MICYKDSKIINVPANRVQTNNYNHCGCITAESLNERFCSGSEIDLEMFDDMKLRTCHMEMEFKYK